jgi:hypothetical protein
MSEHLRAAVAFVFVTCLSFAIVSAAQTQALTTNPNTAQKEAHMSFHAKGPFDVKGEPQTDEKVGDPTIGRMSLDKQYHGDLEATSKGQMLSAMGEVKGSAAYVAIERVRGTLNGRAGTFALVHTGTMAGGKAELSIMVVPDSGTGQLVGISGKMNIIITDGKHSYEFDCSLPEPAK